MLKFGRAFQRNQLLSKRCLSCRNYALNSKPCSPSLLILQRFLQQNVPRNFNHIPLTEPLPGMEHLSYVDPKAISRFDAKITKLPNGLRVATEPNFGEYCTVGVGIEAGARYEANYPLGTSHFIEKLAFLSSKNFSSKEEIFAILENRGALIDCQSTKDLFLYASSCHVDGVDDIVGIIGDAVFRPRFTEEEIDIGRQIIAFENDAMRRSLECEPLLTDWIHKAAFQGNTLGLSKYCDSANVNNINRQHLVSFIKQYFAPSRIVLAGVGVDHDFLVNAAKQYFNENDSTWSENSSGLLSPLPEIDRSIAQYTGGEVRVTDDLSNMALGPTEYPNLAHFILGFEGASLDHPDFVPFCVLNSLMGGGGSFSAGGPGKGMYTRLYTDVLHHYHWMYNSTAYNHSYADAGLFCIRASGPPEKINEMAKIILKQFFLLTEGVDKAELERAKTQLKSQLMMNLEMRPVMFEDLVRQIIAHGIRKKPEEYVELINKVTTEDIVRITERMLHSKPSIVGYGDVNKLQSYEKFDQAVARRDLKILEKSSSFLKFGK